MKLTKTFTVENRRQIVSGCAVMYDDRIVNADYYGCKKLKLYGGTHASDEISTLGAPFDVEAVNSADIAVSFPTGKLEMINIETRTVLSQRVLSNNCWGISFKNNNINVYAVVDTIGIVVVDLSGNISNKIDVNVRNASYMAASLDRIFFTYRESNTFIVALSKGKKSGFLNVKQSFDLQAWLPTPNRTSSSLDDSPTIHNQGTASQTLLNSDDGLYRPQAVCYQEQMRMMSLGYKDSGVAFYNA